MTGHVARGKRLQKKKKQKQTKKIPSYPYVFVLKKLQVFVSELSIFFPP